MCVPIILYSTIGPYDHCVSGPNWCFHCSHSLKGKNIKSPLYFMQLFHCQRRIWLIPKKLPNPELSNETWRCDHSNESSWWVLSNGWCSHCCCTQFMFLQCHWIWTEKQIGSERFNSCLNIKPIFFGWKYYMYILYPLKNMTTSKRGL